MVNKMRSLTISFPSYFTFYLIRAFKSFMWTIEEVYLFRGTSSIISCFTSIHTIQPTSTSPIKDEFPCWWRVAIKMSCCILIPAPPPPSCIRETLACLISKLSNLFLKRKLNLLMMARHRFSLNEILKSLFFLSNSRILKIKVIKM